MNEQQHRAVFAQYYRLVYTIVQGHLGSVARHEDIEECVSDVFAEVFCKQEDAAFDGELRSYIRMVANRRAIDRFRSLAPRAGKTIPLDELTGTPDSAVTETQAEQNELRRVLMECIRELGEPDTTIVLQKYWFGANSSQIAKGLGLTPSAVRKRAGKALGKLKAALQARGFKEGII